MSYADRFGTNTIEFNICSNTTRTCPDEQLDYANLITANQTCFHMTSVLNEKHPDKQTPGTYSLLDKNIPSSGIQISYSGGSECTETQHYSLNLHVVCNKLHEQPSYTIETSSLADPCSPIVIMATKHGCPLVQQQSLDWFMH